MAYACNPTTQTGDVGGSKVSDQPELHSKTSSKNQTCNFQKQQKYETIVFKALDIGNKTVGNQKS
jgi:hypothetical protein